MVAVGKSGCTLFYHSLYIPGGVEGFGAYEYVPFPQPLQGSLKNDHIPIIITSALLY